MTTTNITVTPLAPGTGQVPATILRLMHMRTAVVDMTQGALPDPGSLDPARIDALVVIGDEASARSAFARAGYAALEILDPALDGPGGQSE